MLWRAALLGLLATFFSSVVAVPTLANEPRFAVVIGNASYSSVPALRNPLNDARAMSEALAELGFAVHRIEDTDAAAIATVPRWIRENGKRGGLGLFFYAGHALQHAGHNYLLPVDVDTSTVQSVEQAALVADEVASAMADAGVDVAILILDACRDNPLVGPEEALGAGLATMEHMPGQTLVAYATAAQRTASDGSGTNSPFTSALVSVLQETDLDLFGVFREVRRRVRTATGGRQTPWVSGSVESRVVLHQRPDPAPAPLAPATSAISIYWTTISASANPADIERFLSVSQGAPEAVAATARLKELESRATEALPPIEILRDESTSSAAYRSVASDCDILASGDRDPQRLAKGVDIDLINIPLALRVCAYQLAVDPENSRTMWILARLLEHAGRFAESRALLARSADLGYSAASNSLGLIYRDGIGVAPDQVLAVHYFRQAAILGNPSAYVGLGVAYLNGQGVERSPDAARAWIELAADLGWRGAINLLGDMHKDGIGVEQDTTLAIGYYEKAAALGSNEAMNNLGRFYERGNGVEKDLATARRWFEMATAQGNRFAPRWLARHYLEGLDVEQSAEHALSLLELAVERGNWEAYLDLGHMREKGLGVERDVEKAYLYLLLAEFGGSEKAGAEAQRVGGQLSPTRSAEIRKQAAFIFKTSG